MAASRTAEALVLVALAAAWLAACDVFGPDTLQERRAQLAHARAVWDARGIHDYAFTLGRSCGECVFMDGRNPFSVKVLVRDDTIRAATVAGSDEPLPEEYASLLYTIDGFFDIVAADIESKPYRFSVDYDSVYGYPRNYYVDPSKNVIDDEHGLSATGLAPF